MSIRSVISRLAVTLPFFALAALLLGGFADPVPPQPLANVDGAPILIVTTSELRPAFTALESWNRRQGCETVVLELDRRVTRLDDQMGYLGAVCARRGIRALLIGGNDALMPVRRDFGEIEPASTKPSLRLLPLDPILGTPLPHGIRLGRVPVATLSEAWEFVEACQSSGETLDRLVTPLPTYGDELVASRWSLSSSVAPAAALASAP